MTGLAEAQGSLSSRLGARLKVWSLNSRGLDLSVRILPRGEWPELELAVRRLVAERLARGRVAVVVELLFDPSLARVQLDWELAEALHQELARKPAGLELAPPRLGELLAIPGFLRQSEWQLEPEELGALLQLLDEALARLQQVRAREASLLQPALEAELVRLASFARHVKERTDNLQAIYWQRLRRRMAELLGSAVDEQRLLQEAALAAERADVAEEVSRLQAHIDHFRHLLCEGGPVGRKLDFLVQEMLREVNTAAAKLREVGMGEQVVEAKAALERLREQVANLE